jgi:uncharacterized membrane protein HdeD (DUF308 family)
MNDITDAAAKSSRDAIALGMCVTILGLLAMAMPFLTGITVTISIGVILLATGIAQLVFVFSSDSFGTGVMRFAFGLLAALCGVSMISQPGAGFVVDGIWALVLALQWRPEKGWVWMLFNSVLGIALGIMIYRQFPTSAAWLVGVLVGIRLFFAGWTMIALGSVVSTVTKTAEKLEGT